MLSKISNPGTFEEKNYNWILHEGSPQDDYYKGHNTLHYQMFDAEVPYITEFAEQTFKKFAISLIKQMPGMCIPLHKDTYYFFKQKHGLLPEHNVYRANIFLEDWKPGHYFEAGDEPYVNWKAGDFLMLNKDLGHRSANMGTVPKYTAQVTGILLD